MLKKILMIMLLALSFTIIGVPNNQAEAYWGMVVNCREWITLRSYPSTEARALDRIHSANGYGFIAIITAMDFYRQDITDNKGMCLPPTLSM